MNVEKHILDIITTSGESKALAFEALKSLKTNDYEKARHIMKEAREKDLEAHKAQTQLVTQSMQEGGDKELMTLLMVHAQDHYMTSQLAKDLIEVLIDVFEERDSL